MSAEASRALGWAEFAAPGVLPKGPLGSLRGVTDPTDQSGELPSSRGRRVRAGGRCGREVAR